MVGGKILGLVVFLIVILQGAWIIQLRNDLSRSRDNVKRVRERIQFIEHSISMPDVGRISDREKIEFLQRETSNLGRRLIESGRETLEARKELVKELERKK